MAETVQTNKCSVWASAGSDNLDGVEFSTFTEAVPIVFWIVERHCNICGVFGRSFTVLVFRGCRIGF